MATEEVQFLRDQVHRLNTVLSEYQKQFPQFNPTQQALSLGDIPPAPWLIDQNLISPLIAEYEVVFQQFKQENDRYKEEVGELKQHVDRLVLENKRLTQELKDCIQTQLEEFDVDALKPTTVDDQMLQNLQTQLQLAVQEKESAVEMWQSASQEVDRLETELEGQKSNPSMHRIEQQANMLKQQYSRTLAEMNTEMLNLQGQLRTCKNDEHVAQVQIKELRNTLQDVKQELLSKDNQLGDAASVQTQHEARLEDLELKLSAARTELINLKQKKASLEEKCTELQKNASDHEQREYEAMLQVKDSIQTVENAMLEKDQALVREQQKIEECHNLQDGLNTLINEAGAKTKKEVEAVKKLCNNNISKLMEEIEHLELESSEKQAQLDRAIREKRAAESEIEKLYQEGLVAGSKQLGSYDELVRRACEAEKQRDEALIKQETLQNTLKRNEMNVKQEKDRLQTSLDDLRSQYNQLKQEFETVNEDRITLTNEIVSLKQLIVTMEKERDGDKRKFNKELSCIEQDQKLRQIEFNMKIQSLEDEHWHTVTEIRNLLDAQQKMSARWKGECQSVTQKFESKFNSLQSEKTRLKARNEELTRLLEEYKNKNMEASELISEYTANIKKLGQKVRDSEARLNAQNQLNREHKLRREKRQMQNELERSRLEHSRHRYSDTLLLSELDNSNRGTRVTNGRPRSPASSTRSHQADSDSSLTSER